MAIKYRRIIEKIEEKIKEMMSPDVSQYRKIVHEIMGPNAEENGFKITKSTSAGYSKTMLAEYERRIDGSYTQSFLIDYNFMSNELELQTNGVMEIRSFDGSEEDFRRVISEFANIMHEKGYKNCDEELRKPRYTMAEHGYLLKNYKQLSEKYCKDNNIAPDMDIVKRIYLINDKITALIGKEFVEVKDELIMIAAFYTTTLLQCEGTSMKKYGDLDYFAIVEGDLSADNTLNTILNAWYKKTPNKHLKNACYGVIPDEQFEAIDWRI
ncbi:MAG: hypothetical protein J5802_00255 [Butyrivibrio sp.]|nr:hypothetical protein [Butyrivibrio sp.]